MGFVALLGLSFLFFFALYNIYVVCHLWSLSPYDFCCLYVGFQVCRLLNAREMAQNEKFLSSGRKFANTCKEVFIPSNHEHCTYYYKLLSACALGLLHTVQCAVHVHVQLHYVGW